MDLGDTGIFAQERLDKLLQDEIETILTRAGDE
jgi:hypothetical protein